MIFAHICILLSSHFLITFAAPTSNSSATALDNNIMYEDEDLPDGTTVFTARVGSLEGWTPIGTVTGDASTSTRSSPFTSAPPSPSPSETLAAPTSITEVAPTTPSPSMEPPPPPSPPPPPPATTEEQPAETPTIIPIEEVPHGGPRLPRS
ncbi:hypothetical protein C8J57DRAFT_1601536 [Mycena rebaudengoi]|nr:hypothetical protein C8J57DRAFT_1718147 [Mycena rebaudengoi]KAJ7271851.1 hypothetical protein C8J57DRAFT_1601536 [Mycena rebaudengoi]